MLEDDEHDQGGKASLGKGERTRRKIKYAALQLFAKQGLNSVSVREINHAAGQKNAGSVNYHFSSRDELVAELVRDVATHLDATFNCRLDKLEGSGKPVTIREIAKILILPPDQSEQGLGESGQSFSRRFMNMVLISHRELLFDAMKGQDRATRRCMAHIRRLAPKMPISILQQRLMLVMLYLTSSASAREAAQMSPSDREWLWQQPNALDNVADTVVGIVCAPIDDETLAGEVLSQSSP